MWVSGPKGLKNIQNLVTLTTVAMATKKLSHSSYIPFIVLVMYREGQGWIWGKILRPCFHGNHHVAMTTKKADFGFNEGHVIHVARFSMTFVGNKIVEYSF